MNLSWQEIAWEAGRMALGIVTILLAVLGHLLLAAMLKDDL